MASPQSCALASPDSEVICTRSDIQGLSTNKIEIVAVSPLSGQWAILEPEEEAAKWSFGAVSRA
jgi:hypothetical protein